MRPTKRTMPVPQGTPSEHDQPSPTKRRRCENRSKCRVSFCAQKPRTLAKLTPSSLLSDTEKKDIWWTMDELDGFRSGARDLSLALLVEWEGTADEATMESARAALDDAEIRGECLRGLEHRVCLERQRNKYIANRAVIEAQRRIKLAGMAHPADPALRLAMIAAKCNARAHCIARQVGLDDFSKAYPSASSSVSPSAPLTAPRPLKKCSRKVSIESDGNAEGNKSSIDEFSAREVVDTNTAILVR